MLGGFGLGMVAHFCAQVIAGRHLGPELYGLYGLVIYNASMVAGLFDSGLAVAMTTYTAEATVSGSAEDIRRTLRAGLAIEFVITGCFLCACFLFLFFLAKAFFQGSVMLVLFFVALVIVQGFHGVWTGVLSGLREMRIKALTRLAQQASLLLAMIILVQGLSGEVCTALWVHLSSFCLALLITIFFVKRKMRASTAVPAEASPRFDQKIIQPVLKTAIPVSVSYLAFSCIRFSGPLMLTVIAPVDHGQVLGILVVLLALGRVVDSFFLVIGRSLFPYLLQWNTEGKRKRAGKYLFAVVLLMLVGYGTLILFSCWRGEAIVALAFGRDYMDAAGYLPGTLLVFGSFSIYTVSKIALYSIKQSGPFLVINLIGLAVFFSTIAAGNCLTGWTPIGLLLVAMGLANITIIALSFSFYGLTSPDRHTEIDFSELSVP